MCLLWARRPVASTVGQITAVWAMRGYGMQESGSERDTYSRARELATLATCEWANFLMRFLSEMFLSKLLATLGLFSRFWGWPACFSKSDLASCQAIGTLE